MHAPWHRKARPFLRTVNSSLCSTDGTTSKPTAGASTRRGEASRSVDESQHLINEQTQTLVEWLWIIVSAAATGTFMWATQLFKARRVEERVDHLVEKCIEIDKRVQAVEQGQAANRADHQAILRQLDHIESKLN